ncbi:MAG TPA: anhydro-N-acetylmuramic acid kinase [Bryobacteraceae bacterium]|nr:anhydro-N-acetylmuramic acid kinase [Bryobacteraceae bacterium]
MRVAGVMSGTSLDGIDVAIVELPRIATIGFVTTPYPAALRERLLALYGGGGVAEVSELNFALAELYAKAVRRATERFGAVELIGCHGQTVYHVGGRHTLQIGEPSVLAERTGVAVVSNFRSRDIAAGGQGAPLVPFVDYWLFRHRKRTRIALNIGGIGNITVIPAGAPADEVVAFDTGPGNMVIDALAREISGGKLAYDRDAKLALSGRVDTALLDDLMRDPYYRRKPPKSAGREQYGAEFVARMKASGRPLRDLIATATVLTAATIAAAVRPYQTASADLIASGGGVHNPMVMAHLAALLPGVDISISSDHGIDADAKEAIAFAVLAYQSWGGKPGNLPSATGARRGVILGSITPAC